MKRKMEDNPVLEEIIEYRKTFFLIIVISLVCISLFTIGWVIYRFFFWQPPVDPLPFLINISNMTR